VGWALPGGGMGGGVLWRTRPLETAPHRSQAYLASSSATLPADDCPEIHRQPVVDLFRSSCSEFLLSSLISCLVVSCNGAFHRRYLTFNMLQGQKLNAGSAVRYRLTVKTCTGQGQKADQVAKLSHQAVMTIFLHSENEAR
jgi:hypothetical protein